MLKQVEEWGTRFVMLQAGDADVVAVNPEDRRTLNRLLLELKNQIDFLRERLP